MARTLIRKETPNGWINLSFKTIEQELEGKAATVLIITEVDNNLAATSSNLYYKMDEDLTEEEFHTKIRKEAAEKDQLITSHSTNPEWNPLNYIKNLEDLLKDGH